MATQVFNIAKKGLMDGTIDLDDGTIRVTLVMANTSCGTQEDVDTLSGFTTLDEMDGSGFTWGFGNTGRKTPTVGIVANNTDDRGDTSVTPNPTIWASLGVGSRAVQGALFFKKGTSDDSDAIPIFYLEFAATAANGEDFKVKWDSLASNHVLRMS